MTDFSGNLDKYQARRQYTQVLISEFFSAKSRDVDTSNENRNTYIDILLPKLIDEGLRNFETRLESYYQDLRDVELGDKDSVQTLMNSFSIMENYLMQIYKNRKAEGTKKDFTQIPQGDLDEWNHKYIHQEVMTKIQPYFLKDVNLDGTSIMDSMIEDNLMTDDERESIVHECTSRRRKETFLNLMRGRLSYSTFIDKFIPAIEVEHPDVAGKIKALTMEIQENPPVRTVCAVCNMKETVKHLAEHLRLNGVISADMYEELRSKRTGNASKWAVLLQSVSNPNFITEAINCEFPEMYFSLKNENAMSLQCICQDMDEIETFTVVTDSTLDIADLDDVESLLNSIDAGHSKTLRYKTFSRPKLSRKPTRQHTYVNDRMRLMLPGQKTLPIDQ